MGASRTPPTGSVIAFRQPGPMVSRRAFEVGCDVAANGIGALVGRRFDIVDLSYRAIVMRIHMSCTGSLARARDAHAPRVHVRLGVHEVRFDVPQPVRALVAFAIDRARVHELAGPGFVNGMGRFPWFLLREALHRGCPAAMARLHPTETASADRLVIPRAMPDLTGCIHRHHDAPMIPGVGLITFKTSDERSSCDGGAGNGKPKCCRSAAPIHHVWGARGNGKAPRIFRKGPVPPAQYIPVHRRSCKRRSFPTETRGAAEY